ncbi:MAG: hypothetical protein ABWY00_10870 [Dongiaceae bacterium]
MMAIDDPREIPADARSDRWELLCDGVDRAFHMATQELDDLFWLLHKLCFHRLIKKIADNCHIDWAADEPSSSIAYTVAVAEYAIAFDQGRVIASDVFRKVLEQTPAGSLARIHATYQLAVYYAKFKPDTTTPLEEWLTCHQRELDLGTKSLDPFAAQSLWTRFYRVRAFLPQYKKDMAGMTADMDRAEELARTLPAKSEEESFTAQELLFAVFESRIKEALVFGAPELAAERAKILTEFTPQQSRAHLHLGSALLDIDKIEEAALSFRQVARLGPLGTEIALFNLGQCLELMDDDEAALDAYLSCLAVDPLGIGAAERIRELTAHRQGSLHPDWAAHYIAELCRA